LNIAMNSTHALWLDGKTPLGTKGTLQLQGAELLFTVAETQPPEQITISLSSLSEVKQRGPVWILNFGKDRQGGYRYVFEVRNPDFIAQLTGRAKKRVPKTPAKRVESKLNALPVAVRVVGALLLIVTLFQGYRFIAEHLYTVVPKSFDESLGKLAYNNVIGHFQECRDEETQQIVRSLLDSLRLPDDHFPYSVTVVNDKLQNAFALPGGKIVVMSGLLEKSHSPEDVLGVLAHEIAHVERRHGMKQLCRSLGTLLAVKRVIGAGFEEIELAETLSELAATLTLLSYSRDLEREADIDGAKRLHYHGYSHEGLVRFLKSIHREEKIAVAKGERKQITEWLSTHPDSQERIDMLQKLSGPKQRRSIEGLSVSWDELKFRCRK
jgi:Zn-dependent protease with chaperone function